MAAIPAPIQEALLACDAAVRRGDFRAAVAGYKLCLQHAPACARQPQVGVRAACTCRDLGRSWGGRVRARHAHRWHLLVTLMCVGPQVQLDIAAAAAGLAAQQSNADSGTSVCVRG